MPVYSVPISLNAIVPIEAADKEELSKILHNEVQKAIKKGDLHYEEWQLVIQEEEIE